MTLDGIEIRYPSSFSIKPILDARKGKTASGKTVMDIVARKRRFTLQWNLLYGSDYKTIRDILDGGTFFEFVFPDNKTAAATATVSTDSGITGELLTRNGDWLFKNVELTLEEQ